MNVQTSARASVLASRDYTRAYTANRRVELSEMEKALSAMKVMSLESLRKLKASAQARLSGALLTGGRGGRMTPADKEFMRELNEEIQNKERQQLAALFV